MLRRFLIETFVVYDTLFYDGGVTGDTSSNYYNTNNYISMTVDSTGKTLTNSTESIRQCYIVPSYLTPSSTSVASFNADFVIEMDIVGYSGTSMLQITDSTNNFSRYWSQLGISDNDHIRMVITDDTQQIFVNDETTPRYESNEDLSSDLMIRFRMASGSWVKFKNLKVYLV